MAYFWDAVRFTIRTTGHSLKVCFRGRSIVWQGSQFRGCIEPILFWVCAKSQLPASSSAVAQQWKRQMKSNSYKVLQSYLKVSSKFSGKLFGIFFLGKNTTLKAAQFAGPSRDWTPVRTRPAPPLAAAHGSGQRFHLFFFFQHPGLKTCMNIYCIHT